MGHEKLGESLVVLNEPIPGFDPGKILDPILFDLLTVLDAEADEWGLSPYSKFEVKSSERPLWYEASDGLETTVGYIGMCQQWLAGRERPDIYSDEDIEQMLKTLNAAKSVFEMADEHGRQFHIALKHQPKPLRRPKKH